VEREFEIERCDLPARGRSTEKSIEQMLQTYLRVDTQKMRSASREQGLVQSLLAEQFVRKPMATLQASDPLISAQKMQRRDSILGKGLMHEKDGILVRRRCLD
jgi:hypothetical protein